jgi:FkbM family methyltransferase
MSQSQLPVDKTSYFVDIGANIGMYTMVMLAGGHKVLAFEPMQYNVELLAASITKVGAGQRVRLFKTALSYNTSANLCIEAAKQGWPEINRGNGQLAPPDPSTGICGPAQETVPVRSINGLLDEMPWMSNMCVNAIKADVEGFENFALRGASSVMQGSCPPCVVSVEFFRAYATRASRQLQYGKGVDGNDVFEYLVQELKYTCFHFTTRFDHIPLRKPFTQAANGDYVCLLQHHPRCRNLVANLIM